MHEIEHIVLDHPKQNERLKMDVEWTLKSHGQLV